MEKPLNSIIPIDINQEMQKSFIAYAMAVIINRALPDVRDGLKPVHRRILYSMSELNMYPDKPYRKSARLVGDVLGKYHPHGDTAVYDAMVRMAQDFSTRYMLVDGHGNFGSVDGDGAAAMRYTEARMSKITLELLRDIDKDTVDFYPNFDETLEQPAVLPARFPNLLVNGTGGIAVGMATNIPPHNMAETINATIALIDNPDISIDQLIDVMPGPDFPTGGIIMGVSGIRSAYKTGRGRIRVRAKAEIEKYNEDRERIVVTELPYQVNKAALVEKIAELVHEKRIDGISDLRDESDKSGMRVVIELKRNANANVVLNHLYKHTQMQDTFGVIMLALVDSEPRVLNLKQVLEYYIEHQKDVIVRRTKFELEKAQKRAHILEGLIIALDNIDEIVNLIKKSPDAASARAALIERFGLSEIQAQAILDMRLQRLTGLERDKIEGEYREILAKIDHFNKILSTPQMVLDIIKDDLIEIRDKYSDARRTQITFDEDDIDIDELIAREDMVVTLTHYGYIKRISLETYRAQRRGGRGVTAMSTREEDFAEQVFVTCTHNQLLFFTNKGKVYMKKCYQIPEAGRTAKGTAIVNMLNLDPDEKISAVFPIESEIEKDSNLMIVTKRGVVKKTPFTEYSNIRQNGLKAVNLRDDDELISVMETDGSKQIIVGTRDGMSIIFSEEDVRPMGRVATGVRAIKLRAGDSVVDACISEKDKQILVITEKGYGKRTLASEYRLQSRGGIGLKSMNITDKTGKLCGLKVVDGTEDIMLINDAGVVIRMSVEEISLIGRSTQGVRLMRVDDDTKVVCVAKIVETENDDEELEGCAEQEDGQAPKAEETPEAEPESEKTE
ncbi:DNA gyrase subunit A [Christensenella hongkongensis]|uniref:DNA gyrase subunit A n=1 Tax=Christensenella hongkongensis TaxID=270498 RepID=A0A0M2NJQ4_9FIRM|nr:DNA gyrase subunit A [Christensenella hongkongensis]KKI51196.1 DNA gyrase subunit A [Christensenella hongkongensis]TCW30402.1 DNA gyrase subunit A [Christensenella hongkongensis]